MLLLIVSDTDEHYITHDGYVNGIWNSGYFFFVIIQWRACANSLDPISSDYCRIKPHQISLSSPSADNPSYRPQSSH